MGTKMITAVATICCVASTAWGQAVQKTDSLVIGPGDTVHVQVFDTPELDESARVDDQGNLQLILGGGVRIGGLTTTAAAQAIEKTWIRQQLVVDPKVLVTVEQYATERVSVLGEVRSPGSYLIDTPRSIVDVLALAGGLSTLADRKVVIQRHGTLDKTTYFFSNSAGRALTSAVEVFPGDRIIVPKAGIVYILGDVRQPGGYTMTTNDGTLSVLQLLARAGGLAHSAVPGKSQLIRKTETGEVVEMRLNVAKMEKGKIRDIDLAADDILYIPFSYMRNFAANAEGPIASIGSATVYRY